MGSSCSPGHAGDGLRQARRSHRSGGEEGRGRRRPRAERCRNQGHRGAGLYLRPADGDELRDHDGVLLDPKSPAYTAPLNKIKNESRVYTPEDRAIPLPNSDTPYSVLFMDLRAEPIVLSVPAVEKNRYYSVMLCDGNTFNYGYIGPSMVTVPGITWL